MKTIFKCNFCNKTFKKVLGKNTYEVTCPNCKEIDVEVLGIACKKVKVLKNV